MNSPKQTIRVGSMEIELETEEELLEEVDIDAIDALIDAAGELPELPTREGGNLGDEPSYW